jgi:hypothetical protein
MLSFSRDERGATAVVMAIVVVLLMGLTVLSVDGGQLFMQRRRMVRATDASTLAAAQTCALNFTEGGTLDPQARGLETSHNNVSGSSQVAVGPPDALNANPADGFWWGSIGADPATSPSNTQCNSEQPSGKVVAKYDVETDLLFARMLNRPVSAVATGVWGAAGGGIGFGPFSLQYGRLTECDIYPPPDPENPPAEDCKFYFNDSDEFIGQSSWAPLNLNFWDVPVNFQPCPSAGGAGDVRRWIAGDAPALSLNYPDPTYVCRRPGAQRSVFDTGGCTEDSENLACNEGQEMTFPVNSPCPNTITDPEVGPLPHGQVDGPGSFVCPPGSPMKYDIVGFITLLLVDVVRGNAPRDEFQTKCPEFVGGQYPANPDANAWCMIARWVGYSTGGIEPGEGHNFGQMAVGLSG